MGDKLPLSLEVDREHRLATATCSNTTVGRLLQIGTWIMIVGLKTEEEISATQNPHDLRADTRTIRMTLAYI